MSVPALLHGFILREIDVTLITQYFRPYLRLKQGALTKMNEHFKLSRSTQNDMKSVRIGPRSVPAKF